MNPRPTRPTPPGSASRNGSPNRQPSRGERPAWFSDALTRLSRGFELTPVDLDDESGYYVLTERHADTNRPVVDATVMDDSDESGSLTGTGVTLRRHLDGVGERAGEVAQRLGLPLGTRKGPLPGRPSPRPGQGGPAFPGSVGRRRPGSPWNCWMSRWRSRYPVLPGSGGTRPGMRHEVASVAMVESNPDVLGAAYGQGTWCCIWSERTTAGGRPLPPVIEDPEPRDAYLHVRRTSSYVGTPISWKARWLSTWRTVSGVWWSGTATTGWQWLEAILRLADHQQSAEEVCAAMNGVHLNGLEGTNPLAFLAALGVQVAFASQPEQPRPLVER